MPQDPPSPSGQALAPGTRLEEFVVGSVLGSGGFGITYLARDVNLGHKVVIKENLPAMYAFRDSGSGMIRPRSATGEDAENFAWSMRNFLREADTLASLDHPGIVKVLRKFEANGTVYFVMPFEEGTALDVQVDDRKESGTHFTEEELRGLLWYMLGALEHLHDRGIYHRDIKPGNILITHEGVPVLIDFGSARQRLSEHSMTVVESAGYTPFEQLQSRGNVGPWSDLYALGATLAKAITHETPVKTVDRVGNDPWQPLASRPELAGRYSQGFLAGIDRALVVEPQGRWQDARQWREGVWGGAQTPPPLQVPQPAGPASRLVMPGPVTVPMPSELITYGAKKIPALHILQSARSDPAAEQSSPDSLPVEDILSAEHVIGTGVPGEYVDPKPGPETDINESPGLPQEESAQVDNGFSKFKKRSLAVMALAVMIISCCVWIAKNTNSEKVEKTSALLKAAVQEDPEAQFRLGFAYLSGREVRWITALPEHPYEFPHPTELPVFGEGYMPLDNMKAVKWFRKAAGQGHAQAQYYLGVMYKLGCAVAGIRSQDNENMNLEDRFPLDLRSIWPPSDEEWAAFWFRESLGEKKHILDALRNKQLEQRVSLQKTLRPSSSPSYVIFANKQTPIWVPSVPDFNDLPADLPAFGTDYGDGFGGSFRNRRGGNSGSNKRVDERKQPALRDLEALRKLLDSGENPFKKDKPR